MADSAWLNLFNAELSPKRYWRGTEIPGGGGRWRLYLTLRCHLQNDSCIKMGSDESHLTVSLILKGNFRRDRKAQAESDRGP